MLGSDQHITSPIDSQGLSTRHWRDHARAGFAPFNIRLFDRLKAMHAFSNAFLEGVAQ